ncbi:MAG: phosphatase PAP2 family protein [Candidatus Nanopelagicales bacterium]
MQAEASAQSAAHTRELPPAERAPLYFGIAALCWSFAAVIAVSAATSAVWLTNFDYRVGSWFIDVDANAYWLKQLALVWHWGEGPIGSTIFTIVVAVALLATRHRGWAGYLIACAIGGVVISETVKHLVDRARPSWPDPLITEVGGSFPSGHTMSGIYVWSVVGLIAMYVISGRAGTVLGWALVVFGVLAGPSRLFLGVHWPSDVIGGWMLALGWVLIVSAVALIIRNRRGTQDSGLAAVSTPTGGA